jgi:hypothetical protein
VRLGRLGFSLQIERARGTGWSGLCVFRPTGVPREHFLILAAGLALAAGAVRLLVINRGMSAAAPLYTRPIALSTTPSASDNIG